MAESIVSRGIELSQYKISESFAVERPRRLAIVWPRVGEEDVKMKKTRRAYNASKGRRRKKRGGAH